MRLVTSRVRLVAALLVAALAVPLPAAAHNGVGAFFKGPAGRYLVYAYDPDVLASGEVEYRLVVVKRKTTDPVYDVTTTITATRGGSGDGPARATGEVTTFGNVVFYRLPNPYPGHWVVTAHLDGPLGKGAATFRAHGLAPTADPVAVEESDPPVLTYLLVAVAAVVVVGALVFWLVRRRTWRHA